MNSSVIIPFTVQEWRRVHSLYASDDPADLKECHNILSLWCCRMDEKTPMFVSCTELIFATLLFTNRAYEKDKAYMESTDSRRQISIAVIRFVNYISELGQRGASDLVSVAIAAGRYGVPRWMVELRHDATHNHLPPLAPLRKALSFARDWLWQRYWEKAGVNALPDSDKHALSQEWASNFEAKEQMNERIVVEYANWRQKNKTYSELEGVPLRRPPPVDSVHHRLRLMPAEMLRTLVNFFILPDEDSDCFEGVEAPPPGVQQFWEPIMSLLVELRMLAAFVVELMHRLRGEGISLPARRQIAAWVKLVITSFADDEEMFSEREWSSILRYSLCVPKCLDKETINIVLERDSSLSQQRRKRIARLLEIEGEPSTRPLMAEDELPIRTVEDVHKMILSVATPVPKRSFLRSSQIGWQRADDIDWRDLPMGLCSGQDIDSFSLIIEPSHLEKWAGEDAPQRKRSAGNTKASKKRIHSQ